MLCGEELLSNSSDPIKEFTLASCGHIFHQKCFEKYLVNGEARCGPFRTCPNKDCNKDIETFLSPDLFKEKKNKGIELEDKPTKPSADETNNTASTIATAKQVDSDQTPVDDVEDPLESERHTEVQLSASIMNDGVYI